MQYGKVLIKLFQKLAWSSARALVATAVAKCPERRFLLLSFSLRLSQQRKAGKGFECAKFRVINIKLHLERSLNSISRNRLSAFSLMPQAQRKSLAKRNAAKRRFASAEATGAVEVGGQAVLGRQCHKSTPWPTDRHGHDPTSLFL